MSILTLIALILPITQQKELPNLLKNTDLTSAYWTVYKNHYKLKIHEIEDHTRKEIFAANLLRIEAHNQKNLGFKMAMNLYGHLTDGEFKKQHLSPTSIRASSRSNKIIKGGSIDSVDWRTKNVVNPIKNQYECRSSYAFSGISSLESAVAIKTGKLLQLSEQDILDCSHSFGNNDCNGGLVKNVFKYIMKNGIRWEHDYPYVHWYRNFCILHHSPIVANITSYVEIDSGDENALTVAISNIGPVSAGIVCSTNSFRFYKSGIYYEPECNGKALNHFVAIVGVTDEYYIVRNSWGSGWGNEGYIYMARNKDNNCGIATSASYPVV